MKKKLRLRTGRKTSRPAVGILAGITVCMLTTAAGCGSITDRQEAGPGDFNSFQLSEAAQELTDPKQSRKDYGDVSVTDTFRSSYGEFALKLLLESQKGAGENLMVSPLSVMVALEMARNGARGETEEQMREVLYGAESAEISQELMAYLNGLPSQEDARFHFANSIWFRKGEPAFNGNEDFLKTSAESYGAQIYAAPFDESTLRDINGWVEWETEGMISDILKEIPEEAMMYLINAMAFNAQWQTIYASNQVHRSEFFPEEGGAQTVEMMYSTEGYLLGDGAARGFWKPYTEGYAFAALLPEEGICMEEYLAGLTGEDLIRTLSQPQETAVETGLPKFSAKTQLMLNPVLEKLGMPMAFDPDQADFSGMEQYQNRNLYLGQVIMSTFIQVDEQGTKAGAATVVEGLAGGAQPPEQVILNRPFLYAVMDTETKLPIFLGILEVIEEN